MFSTVHYTIMEYNISERVSSLVLVHFISSLLFIFKSTWFHMHVQSRPAVINYPLPEGEAKAVVCGSVCFLFCVFNIGNKTIG